MALTPCIGCGRLLATGSRCLGCKLRRPSGNAWAPTRTLVLARDGWRCQDCGQPANVVDHIEPIAHGGTDHPSNLQAPLRRLQRRQGCPVADSDIATGSSRRCAPFASKQQCPRPRAASTLFRGVSGTAIVYRPRIVNALKPKPLNSSRVYLDRFVQRAASSVPPGALVLDAGAGEGPYRAQFARHRYESTDFEKVAKKYQPNTYVCDLTAVPVEDGRFDLVLLTQVLEHLPEPLAALREMHRITKPSCQLWASAPLFYEEHERPYDFFRYTQFSLRHLFSEAGFSNLTVEWLEGYWGTVSYELQVAARSLGRPFGPMLTAAGNAFARADLRNRRTDIGHPKNYTIVATA